MYNGVSLFFLFVCDLIGFAYIFLLAYAILNLLLLTIVSNFGEYVKQRFIDFVVFFTMRKNPENGISIIGGCNESGL